MSLIIEIKTIPQKQHRYSTLGDYLGHEKLRFIQVSDMDNAKYEFLIALHELIEQSLQIERGIPEEEITKFDIEFNKRWDAGEVPEEIDEAGNDPDAPYHKEHVFATKIEKMVCEELGLSWNAYDRYMNEFIEKNTV